MKKIIIKLLIIIWLISSLFILNTNAIDISNIEGISDIKKVTISNKAVDSDIIKEANNFGFSILRIAKIILQAVLVVFIVYIWWKMIMSMWSDDWELTKAKAQLRYSLIAIVFINIPWVIYQAITQADWNKNIWWGWAFTDPSAKNILINMDLFWDWFLANIISAIEVFIFTISVYVIIMAGIKMLTSRWRDEKIKEAKEKILYSIFAMIFVWLVEAWKQFAITWNMSYWTSIFWKITDMALLFAWPVVIAFLTYAWYIYITANWEDEKVKKAKNIVINTFIAIIILLIMVTFLNDLITLV